MPPLYSNVSRTERCLDVIKDARDLLRSRVQRRNLHGLLEDLMEPVGKPDGG
jgi:hypothetical protein